MSKSATEKILLSYPDHIPVVVKNRNEINAEDMRFLVPRSSTVATILRNIRGRLKMTSTESIFLYFDQFLLPVHQSIEEIYARHHDRKDLRLYLQFAKENTFG